MTDAQYVASFHDGTSVAVFANGLVAISRGHTSKVLLDHHFFAFDNNLNRAIVECVAKMQKAKVGA